MQSRTDVAQISQGLSYKVCFITSSNFSAFGSYSLVSRTSVIICKELVAMLRRHVKFFYTSLGHCWLRTKNVVLSVKTELYQYFNRCESSDCAVASYVDKSKLSCFRGNKSGRKGTPCLHPVSPFQIKKQATKIRLKILCTKFENLA